MLEAKITAVSLKDGERPYFPEELRKTTLVVLRSY
jgi:hypothetical protein